jgi:hypothetical protein
MRPHTIPANASFFVEAVGIGGDIEQRASTFGGASVVVALFSRS